MLLTPLLLSKIGVESSLSGEITDGFTLGASILSASNAIDSKNLDVKGISMDVYAITGFWDFIPVQRSTFNVSLELFSLVIERRLKKEFFYI